MSVTSRAMVYIAGPDVFRNDAQEWAETTRAACAARGLEALIPLDGAATTPHDIYANNVAMIRAADAVIANLNPFRGAEPDSGTCLEVGFALALGKPVVAYIASNESICARVARLEGRALRQDGGHVFDTSGMRVENFGMPLNLMLTVPTEIVADFQQALEALVVKLRG